MNDTLGFADGFRAVDVPEEQDRLSLTMICSHGVLGLSAVLALLMPKTSVLFAPWHADAAGSADAIGSSMAQPTSAEACRFAITFDQFLTTSRRA